jgi:hypothetical protein
VQGTHEIQRAPQGHGSPLHVHHNKDEWCYVTEGTDLLGRRSGDRGFGRLDCLPPPRCPAHLPCQLTRSARFLLVVEPAGFEGFVRDLSAPALNARSHRRPSDHPCMMTATVAK